MKRAISIAITLLMLMSGMFGMINGSAGSENTAGISSAPGNNVLLLTNHAPIRINNDSNFTSQATSEGWNGSGTQADPYIIENYNISGTNAGSCLYIGNTTVYFVVRNCSLHDAGGNSGTYFWNSGAVLYNVTGGILDNNTVSSNINNGILLNSASNNTIANSTFSSCTYGITVADTDNAQVHNNTCINNAFGIHIDNSTNVDVRGNTVDNERQYYGIMNPTGVDLGSYQVPVNVSYTDGITGNFSNIRFFDENNQPVPYWIEEYENGSWARVWLNLSSIPAEGTSVFMSVLDASAPSGSNGSAVFYYFEDFKNDADGWTYTEDDDNGYYDGMRNDTYWNTTDNWSYMLVDNDPSGSPNNPAGSYLRLSTNVSAPSNAKVVWDGKIGSWSMDTNDRPYNDFEAEFYMDGGRQWKNNKLTGPNGGEHPEFDDMEYNLTTGSHNISFQVYRNSVLWSGTSFHFYFDTVRVRNYTSPEPYAVSTTGILLNDSDLNTINGNTIGGMGSGISMKGSGWNEIFSNRISNSSGYGIYLSSSSNNTIYHNNFINNTNQAYDDTGTNRWNASYPEGGNYWSDYNGTDNYSGPGQNIPGPDGIGDTPYTNIGGGSGAKDNYPLMHPTWYPSIEIISPSEEGILNVSTVTVSWEGSADSGINHYEIQIDGGNWTNVGLNTSYSFSGLSDGSHTVDVTAVDNKSNENTASVTFTVDTTVPQITIDSPSNGTIFNTTVTVSWHGSDATSSGISHYEIRNDSGPWLDVGLNTSYNFTVLSDGSHTVDVKAVDNASNKNTTSVNFTVDATAPEVTIDSPSDGTIFNTTTVTVSWNGSDVTTGVDYYEIRIDSGNWTNVGLNTSYNFTGLSDGSRTVDVKAVDNASNKNTTSVTFAVDTTAPEITITSPSDGAILNTANVTVSWSGSDATSGIDHYELRNDSGTWIDVGLNTSYNFTGLSDGSHTVDVKAVDNASNGNTTSVTFTVDTTAPEIIIDSPSDGAIFNKTTVTVSWAGSDATSGIDHYEIRNDSGSWLDVGLNTSYNFTVLSDGSHTVDVKAVDNASNKNTTSVNFTVDATAPEITIDSPSDGTIFNTTTVTVSWNGSDVTTGVDYYEIRIDSGNWTNVGLNTSYNFTVLSDGSHTVDVKAVDNASNENTTSVTFTVDKTAPQITITSPSDGAILNTVNVTVSWAGSDATSGIDHYEIRNDSGTWINVGMGTNYTFIGLSDGSHTVDVKAVDNASNENTTSVTFTVDTTTPEVTIDSPSNGTILNTTNVTVSWTGSDVTTGIDHYEIRIDSGDWTSVGLNTNYNFTGLSDGSHTVDVKAVDNASNENTDSVIFTLDATPPTVVSHSPMRNNVSVDTVITVTFSEAMDHSTVHIDIKGLNGSIAWNNNTATFTPSQNLSYDTNYTVNVTGSDLAGNSMEDAWSFSTEKAPATTETGTITGTVTDTNGNPVAGATVTLDSGETATTNATGQFEIQASVGNHTVTISKDGYKTETRSTSVTPGEVNKVQIQPLAASQENNGLLWLWLLLIIIVLAAIGVMVAKRKKPSHVSNQTEENAEETPEETEATGEAPSSTEEIPPSSEESTETEETPMDEQEETAL